MAVHFTLYLDEEAAGELRRFMAVHNCSPTAAAELLLARWTAESPAPTSLREQQTMRRLHAA